MYVLIFICIYMYTYKYIHMYIYIYIHTCSCLHMFIYLFIFTHARPNAAIGWLGSCARSCLFFHFCSIRIRNLSWNF